MFPIAAWVCHAHHIHVLGVPPRRIGFPLDGVLSREDNGCTYCSQVSSLFKRFSDNENEHNHGAASLRRSLIGISRW